MHPLRPDPPPRTLPSHDGLFEQLKQRKQVVVRARPRPRLRWQLPLFLFLATCVSTVVTHSNYLFRWFEPGLEVNWKQGLIYGATVMAILTAHEFGHYLQARRYGVPASLPYFLPMPLSLFGTLGAVIVMRPRKAGPKALFDIAATGPLAGLLPALLACFFGLRWSELVDAVPKQEGALGVPLIFDFFSFLVFGNVPEGQALQLHPLAFAGWVGLFITALNLLPIGQLDGGHILYTLVGKRAHFISVAFLGSAAIVVLVDATREIFWQSGIGYWPWGLLVLLLFFLGVKHPPTADDGAALGPGRTLLGWALLLFVILGFTPRPLIF